MSSVQQRIRASTMAKLKLLLKEENKQRAISGIELITMPELVDQAVDALCRSKVVSHDQS